MRFVGESPMKKFVLFACVSAFALTLSACGSSIERYDKTIVNAVVVEKEFDKGKVKKERVVKNGSTTTKVKTKNKPDEYEVVLRYQDVETEFESRNDDFYDSVKVGDTVKVNLVKGYDKDGNLVQEYLELINQR